MPMTTNKILKKTVLFYATHYLTQLCTKNSVRWHYKQQQMGTAALLLLHIVLRRKCSVLCTQVTLSVPHFSTELIVLSMSLYFSQDLEHGRGKQSL